MNEFFKCSFISSDPSPSLRMTPTNKLQKRFFRCSFLSVRKERKEACSTKELLKLCFVPLRQNNFPDESGFEQILSFNPEGTGTPLHTIFSRNFFDERKQKEEKFFMSKQITILLMCGSKSQKTKTKEGSNDN